MSDMDQLYQQLILDHARSPHGRGLLDPEQPAWGDSHQLNPTCGDEITLRVELVRGTDGAEHVSRVTWDGQGCSISQASASVLTDLVAHQPVDRALEVGETFRALMGSRGAGLDDDQLDLLGDASAFTGVARFPARIKCALLGWSAFQGALLAASAPHDPRSTSMTDTKEAQA